MEKLVTEAERLAHEAFADDPDSERTYYIVGLVADKRTTDPRDDPNSARSIITTGKTDFDREGAELVETEQGYAVRFPLDSEG